MRHNRLPRRLPGAVAALLVLVACGRAAPGGASVLPTAALVIPSPGQAHVVVASPLPTVPPSPTPAPRAVTETPVAAPPDPARAREAQLIDAVNALRAQHGLAAYRAAPTLSEVARMHSCDLAAHGVISHRSSDGRTLQDRLGAEAARWSWPSESIAAGTDAPAGVIALWLDEPPDGWHRRNLLDPDQQVIGVGYCVAPDDPSGNRHYWTMIVTRPAA